MRSGRPDVAGGVTITLGVTALLYAVSEVPAAGFFAPRVLAGFAAGAVLIAAFGFVESRTAAPLVPLPFLRRPWVAWCTAAMFMKSTVGISTVTLSALYLQEIRHWTPLATGLAFAPAGVTGLITGFLGARVIRALHGPSRAAAIGMVVQIIGLLLITQLPLTGFPALMLVGNFLVGPGLVLPDVALTSLLTSGLDEDERGLGAGVFRTAGQLGAGMGLGVAVAVTTALAGAPGGSAPALDLIDGLQGGVVCGALFSGAALASIVALHNLRSKQLQGQATP